MNKLDNIQVCFLLSRCRTGSTTLGVTANKSPHVACYMEILNGALGHSYQNFVLDLVGNNKAAREEFLGKGPLFAFANYVKALTTQAQHNKPNVRLVIFECKIENLFVLSDQWCHPAQDLSSIGVLSQIMEIAETIIFLRRLNVVERFCSDLVANATKIYHSDQGKQSLDLPKHHMNIPDAIGKFTKEIEYDVQFFTYLSKKKGKRVFLFEYEKIYREQQFSPEFVGRFADIFFGIKLEQPTMAKVRTRSAGDIISNFADLQIAMQNSPLLSTVMDYNGGQN